MFPAKTTTKIASTNKDARKILPEIVLESKNNEQSLQSRLQSQFTIGNISFDQKLKNLDLK